MNSHEFNYGKILLQLDQVQSFLATMSFAAAMVVGNSTDMNVHRTLACDFVAMRL